MVTNDVLDLYRTSTNWWANTNWLVTSLLP